MLQNGETVAYGLVWVPRYFDIENKLSTLDLNGLSLEKGPDAIKGLVKPTYFRLNEFTWIF